MRLLAWSVVVVGAIALGWRWLSRRHSLPCPAWLGLGVDLPGVSALFGTQQTLDRIGVRTGDRVLEIGPGPGRLLIPVARMVQPSGEAVGVDVQAAILKSGGVLSITEMIPDPHFIPQRAVRRLAEAVGFRHHATHGTSLAFTMNFQKPANQPLSKGRNSGPANI